MGWWGQEALWKSALRNLLYGWSSLHISCTITDMDKTIIPQHLNFHPKPETLNTRSHVTLDPKYLPTHISFIQIPCWALKNLWEVYSVHDCKAFAAFRSKVGVPRNIKKKNCSIKIPYFIQFNFTLLSDIGEMPGEWINPCIVCGSLEPLHPDLRQSSQPHQRESDNISRLPANKESLTV